jgi:hypothetical protein
MYEGYALRRELADEKLKEARFARIEELENQVFEQAAQIAVALFDFCQVSPDQTEPPPEWIAQFGPEGAKQRLAVAKSGWLPPSLAPNAVSHAVKMMTGISRGRQHRLRVTAREVNVKLVLPAPTSREHPGPTVYPTKELDE